MKKLILIPFILALGWIAALAAQNDSNDGSGDTPQEANKVLPYTLPDCMVCGNPLTLGNNAQTLRYPVVHNGEETLQEMQFDCYDCVRAFTADPEKYMQRYREATKTWNAGQKTGEHPSNWHQWRERMAWDSVCYDHCPYYERQHSGTTKMYRHCW